MDQHILSTLFEVFDGSMSQKENDILREGEDVLGPLADRLSVKEWDTLWDTARRSAKAETEDRFMQGFRLGVQLTLAGLEPVCDR